MAPELACNSCLGDTAAILWKNVHYTVQAKMSDCFCLFNPCYYLISPVIMQLISCNAGLLHMYAISISFKNCRLIKCSANTVYVLSGLCRSSQDGPEKSWEVLELLLLSGVFVTAI